jgi:hypothetical protein
MLFFTVLSLKGLVLAPSKYPTVPARMATRKTAARRAMSLNSVKEMVDFCWAGCSSENASSELFIKI